MAPPPVIDTVPESALVRRAGALRVGDLAKRTGKTVRALHLYEELGLLEPSLRSKGGFRLYDRESELRVRFIAKLQDMGFSLSEIQAIVRDWAHAGSAPDAMKRLRDLYTAKLAETRSQIARLHELEQEMQASLDYLDTCDTCDPKRVVASCTCCDQHEEGHTEPELVKGVHQR